MTTLRLAALAAGTAFALAAAPASAQLFARPPADVPQAVQGPDVAAVGVRVERLEGQIRTLTGQIEQLQNRNRQLEEQMKRFQQDVEFRFQEQGGRKPVAAPPAPAQTPAAAPGRRSSIESAPVAAPQAAAPQNASPQTPAPQVVAPQVAAAPSPSVRIDPSIKVDPSTLGPFAARAGATGMAGASGAARPGRNDAFDPAANPAAPGAPRPLGATRPSAPLSRAELAGAGAQSASVGAIIDEPGAGAPLDLANPRPVGAPPASEPRVIAAPAAAGGAPAFDAAPLDPARADYDHAMIAYRNGQYDTADALLRQFVQKHPADRMVADAVYFRGETLAQRGRNADAAEQFLKVTTDFSQSSRAPDAMLKLGQSLKAMGEKEQACATFAEIPRKHPRASGAVKGAEREMKRNAC